ncbi:hypothetical protein Pan14r_40750 [Crateriforma conspicua]|uniref:SLA1 homology domain-containing protein n=1 Tax=Crateriforma conspicua TaxID=2527996 RepID=A0A5C5Y9Y4_9PLAN|nr:hypothetical protein Pan14r_40750 [Crateriforma conspicua]
MSFSGGRTAGHCVCLILMCFLSLCHSVVRADELHVWRDSTGKFSVTATLVSSDGESVQLRTEAGRETRVPIKRLSAADQRYLKTIAGKSANSESSPDASGKTLADDPAAIEQQILRTLHGKAVAVSADDTLADFFSRLPCPVYVDVLDLNRSGVTERQKIGTVPKGATVAEQLYAILKPLEMTWQTRRTMLVIGSGKRRDGLLQTAVYFTGSNDSANVVKRFSGLEPSSWESMGGPGSISILGPRAIVRQSGLVHHMIQTRLPVRPIPTRYLHPLDQQMIDVVGPIVSLTQFADSLGPQIGRSPRVDIDALSAIGMSADVKIRTGVDRCSTKDALDVFLASVGCTWFEQDDTLTITTQEAAEKSMQDSQFSLQAFGAGTNVQSLLQVIHTTVAPEQWEALGGKCQISPVGSRGLSVSANQPVLRELMQLSATLRGAQ